MNVDSATHCCAVNEFYGMNSQDFTPIEAVKVIMRGFWRQTRIYDEKPTAAHYVLFMKYNEQHTQDALQDTPDRLFELEAYIEKHKLGTLVIGEDKMNPNSGNRVVPAIFTPDWDNTLIWCDKNGIDTTHKPPEWL